MLRFLATQSILFAGFFTAAGLSFVNAATPPLEVSFRPSWFSRVQVPERYSSSRVLMSEYRQTPENDFLIKNDFIDAGTQRNLKLEYARIMRDFDRKNAHGLRYEDRQHYHSQREQFSRYVSRVVMKKKFDESLKKAKKNSKEIATIHAVNQQVAKAAKGNVKVQVSETVRLRTKLNIPKQKAGLYLNTPVVDGSVDYFMGEDPFDPNLALNGPRRNFERFRLGLGKKDKRIGIYTGMNYGGSSTRMSALVSKTLAKGFACEVFIYLGPE